MTGKPVCIEELMNQTKVPAGHHVCPERKFANGEPFDLARTERQHVRAAAMRRIVLERYQHGDSEIPADLPDADWADFRIDRFDCEEFAE